MPNRMYQRGVRYEYKIMRALRSDGYTVLRMSGSHGFADLCAIKDGNVRFIQSKASKTGYVSPSDKEVYRAVSFKLGVCLELWVNGSFAMKWCNGMLVFAPLSEEASRVLYI